MRRRTLLGLLLAGSVGASAEAAQRRLRFVQSSPAPPPGEPSGDHPRTLLSTTGDYTAANLRTQLAADTNGIRTARWVPIVASFEASGGDWATLRAGTYFSRGASTVGIAAFFAAVRTASNDLGITWQSTRQQYIDTCWGYCNWFLTSGSGNEWEYTALALVYDLLYNDLSQGQRDAIHPHILNWAQNGEFCNGRWDDQTSSAHITTAICCAAADTGDHELANVALLESQDWADARYEVCPFAYEWKQGYPANLGAVVSLWILRNRLGLTDAETTDLCVYHLQHTWQMSYAMTVPHPGRALPFTGKFGMSEACNASYNECNFASALLWAMAIVPGNASLDGTQDIRGRASFAIADQATLATSESALLGYARTHWDAYSFDNLFLYKDSRWSSTTVNKPVIQAFLSLIPALIMNAQKPTAVSGATAGIPLVRRWWPGTLDMTTIRTSHTVANASGDSLITYWHRKYYIQNYEGSSRHNGNWQVHRDGPLLIHRGNRGHGIVTRHWTKSANGCVSIVDPDLYPRYAYITHEGMASGGQRIAGVNSDYWTTGTGWRDSGAAVLENAATHGDVGTIDGWYASSKAVVIRSNLKNSYNNDEYPTTAQAEPNDPKVTAFTRDFIVVRRNGDGTTREKVFTYDRITLVDTGDEPRYNINPGPPQVDIDGTETAQAGWAPQGAVPDVPAAIQPISDGTPNQMTGDGETPPEWYASGPTEWHYTGATRIIVHNNTEPSTNPNPSSKQHTVVGSGKCQVTPLIGGNAASPTNFTIRKNGGTAATRYSGGSPAVANDGVPHFGEWHGWAPCDENDWADVKGTGQRAYVGMYNCQIVPNTIVADTRFAFATEVMAFADTPGTAALLTCDVNSVAMRCGASVAVVAKSASGHSSGNVDIPSGVTLVVFANLPASTARTFTPTGGLSVTSTTSPASASGVIEVVVSGGGNLAWS